MFARCPLHAGPLHKECLAEERRYCPPNLGRKQAFWVMHSAYLFLDARLHRSMTVISPKDMSIEDALPITMQTDTKLAESMRQSYRSQILNE